MIAYSRADAHRSLRPQRIRQAHYVGPCGENGTWIIPRDARQYQLVLKSVSNLHGHDAVFQAEIDIITFM